MMSKKQWFALLCLLIVYMLLGAVFFYEVETRDESQRRQEEREERRIIEELIHKHYVPSMEDTQEEIFDKLTQYCGKPMHSNMTDLEDPPKWDFYHSLFFVITVVTTVGYGNLAPTTPLGRMFMIFYSLIGIPINGIVMVTLGEYFGKSFTKLYNRWKTSKMEYDTTRLGLISQIALYLLPGFTFFIFLPAFIIMVFEDWPYELAVYYCYVTITTIGFGDYVAGVNKAGDNTPMHLIYKIFLLFWIVIGLGYGLMVIGFISMGLRSKKMHALEHALAKNIKKTPSRIREELRTLVHEFLLMKVKRVYKDEFVYTPKQIERSQSCPDLSIYRGVECPVKRKRALSECISCGQLMRVQSDTDLNLIDKERTFTRKISEHSNLLMRVASALGNMESGSDEGVDGFSESEILKSEYPTLIAGSAKLLGIPFARKRACSEIKFPFSEKINHDNNLTWYGRPSFVKLQEIREEVQHGKARSRTLPIQPPNFLTKIKNTIKGKDDEKLKDVDVEKELPPTRRTRLNSEATNRYLLNTMQGRHSMFPSTDNILEDTSIADLLRLLTEDADDESTKLVPQRKLGTASLTPSGTPPRSRRQGIRPPIKVRKGSLMPPSQSSLVRRLSLRSGTLLESFPFKKPNKPSPSLTIPSIPTTAPASLVPQPQTLPSPPVSSPYTPFSGDIPGRRSIRAPGSNRRFSLRPVINFLPASNSPVQRQVRKKDEVKESKDVFSEKL